MVTINDLPAEVFEKIVACVDEIDPSAGWADVHLYGQPQLPLRTRRQTATLRSLSLVCRTFRTSAQHRLCRRVEIRKSGNLKILAETLQTRPDLASRVDTLYVSLHDLQEGAVYLATCLGLLGCLKASVLETEPYPRFDMTEPVNVLPTAFNLQLTYFGMSGMCRQDFYYLGQPAPDTTLCSLPHSITRLDMRQAQLPLSAIENHPGLEVLFIDNECFSGRTDVIETILSLTKIVYVELSEWRNSPAPYRKATTHLRLFRNIEVLPRFLMTDYSSLKSLEISDSILNPEDIDCLPQSLEELSWTYQNRSELFPDQILAATHALLRRLCFPSFLPCLQAMPIIGVLLEPPQELKELDSTTLELVEKATDALTYRKLPAIVNFDYPLSSKVFSYVQIFPQETAGKL